MNVPLTFIFFILSARYIFFTQASAKVVYMSQNASLYSVRISQGDVIATANEQSWGVRSAGLSPPDGSRSCPLLTDILDKPFYKHN